MLYTRTVINFQIKRCFQSFIALSHRFRNEVTTIEKLSEKKIKILN